MIRKQVCGFLEVGHVVLAKISKACFRAEVRKIVKCKFTLIVGDACPFSHSALSLSFFPRFDVFSLYAKLYLYIFSSTTS